MVEPKSEVKAKSTIKHPTADPNSGFGAMRGQSLKPTDLVLALA